MSTLTLNFPDDKHERLKSLAQSRQTSLAGLLDELVNNALASLDARSRLEAHTHGEISHALRMLDNLDQAR